MKGARVPPRAWILRIGRNKVKGFGSACWRIVGCVEAMVQNAKAIDQDWMKGIGYGRWLAKR